MRVNGLSVCTAKEPWREVRGGGGGYDVWMELIRKFATDGRDLCDFSNLLRCRLFFFDWCNITDGEFDEYAKRVADYTKTGPLGSTDRTCVVDIPRLRDELNTPDSFIMTEWNDARIHQWQKTLCRDCTDREPS